jgi:hypothetical protein
LVMLLVLALAKSATGPLYLLPLLLTAAAASPPPPLAAWWRSASWWTAT